MSSWSRRKGSARWCARSSSKAKACPAFLRLQQDATGRARALALAYAKAIGGGRAGIIETTFAEETEADMFAEQAVLCGGMSALIQAGFETLVKAGYQPEMAYFECLHELKFIVDLVHRAGIAGMRERISETAKWGDVSVGPKIIDKNVRKQMEAALRKIQNGSFAKEWLRETATGRKRYRQLLERGKNQPIEKVGERLRALMPWLQENRLNGRALWTLGREARSWARQQGFNESLTRAAQSEASTARSFLPEKMLQPQLGETRFRLLASHAADGREFAVNCNRAFPITRRFEQLRGVEAGFVKPEKFMLPRRFRPFLDHAVVSRQGSRLCRLTSRAPCPS